MLQATDPCLNNKPSVSREDKGVPYAKPEKSSLVSRNVTVGAHRTSVRLEPDMWNALREVCRREHVTHHDIATLVSGGKADNTSLTAALRVFIMNYFRCASTEEGHTKAGHGPGGMFMAGLVSKRLDRVSHHQENGAQVVTLRLSGMR